jgi:hypothetical protein
MKKVLIPVILLLLLLGSGLIVFKFYEYIFAKTITGKIVKVERVNQENMVITSGARPVPAEQLFSFAVAIKDKTSEIHTASSEDRQWAVATPGQCVEAKFFPYPPWHLERWGTYHNARLLRLSECPPEEEKTASAPASESAGAGIAPGEWDDPSPSPSALPTDVPTPLMTLAPDQQRKTPAQRPNAGSDH